MARLNIQLEMKDLEAVLGIDPKGPDDQPALVELRKWIVEQFASTYLKQMIDKESLKAATAAIQSTLKETIRTEIVEFNYNGTIKNLNPNVRAAIQKSIKATIDENVTSAVYEEMEAQNYLVEMREVAARFMARQFERMLKMEAETIGAALMNRSLRLEDISRLMNPEPEVIDESPVIPRLRKENGE